LTTGFSLGLEFRVDRYIIDYFHKYNIVNDV
jgi:hypothetical protein